ncbi:isopenicillin N synthase-like dioxygenase [Nocardia tenerifensis]|uniref:Isopenicillin N synthase-like dioxygenase n=1 Tax=Nocardia tenerifensis TaxID=228006 RepID=A0A318JU14_9NOCA|nr:2-oxoglutarate and iron-dependent oxygenase domain-containing protein [Nocardia tenerifensis]PXX57585.1 isopenicillin N synthase-like dioxygenase [Nocardia tenerifensis]
MSTPNGVTVIEGFVPVIDLSARRTDAGRKAIAQAIGQACTSSGFFTIVGHGVPENLIDRMCTTTREFFTMPDEAKDLVAHRPGVSGFRRMAGSTAHSLDKKTPPDLCEVFSAHVTGNLTDEERANLGDYWASWKLANVWPEEPSNFADTWREYMMELTHLAADLMRLFALALELKEDFFDDIFDRHVSSVAVNYYFPQQQAPLPGQLRRGEHTDWGSLTILYQDTAVGGLQVRHGSDEWRDVPVIPGGFIVNIGDLMSLWTGGRWVSTMHRVINPERGNTSSRLSIPFFYLPNHDAAIDPIGSFADGETPQHLGATTAGQWISRKMQKTFSADPSDYQSAD